MKVLLKIYVNAMSSNTNFKLSDSGLHIKSTYPYMDASPDAITSYDCCGKSIIEIKCPYMSRDETIAEICQKKNSFLIEDEAGNLTLKNTHEYFYQVQTQLLVTNADHCDFIVWTNKDFFRQRIHHGEILQETIIEKASVFFCILPELLAR